MPNAPLVETTLLQDTFAQGVEIKDAADIVWLTFWTDHATERHSVVRVAMPIKAYHRMIREMVGSPTMLC